MKERTQLAVKLILSHFILLTGLTLSSIFIIKDAYLIVSIAQTVLCILYFAGYWEFLGQRFKGIFCTSMQFFLMVILVWKIYFQINLDTNFYLIIPLGFIQLYLLIELIKILLVIFKKDASAVEIDFPLKEGTYLITDGGNSKTSRLMNYHYYSPVHKKNKTNNSMLYATDIVKVDADKPTFFPESNDDYSVFGEKVYSPINGIVVKVANDIPDNKPYSGNYPYNTGNTVVIKNADLYLLLGHLRESSIVVKVGDAIQTNDLIGAAGNSGWSERSHLHMQLIKSQSDNYWSGQGISILYTNKNLYKNRLIKL
jgi:hypothetical protein